MEPTRRFAPVHNPDATIPPWLTKDLRLLSILWAILLGTFAVARGIEYAYLTSAHALSLPVGRYELVGLLHDLDLSLTLALGLAAVYLLGRPFGRAVAFGAGAAGTALLGVLHLSLARYYTTTLQPLGTDFWAYEPQEVLNTLSASTAVDPLFGGLAVGLAAGPVAAAYALRRWPVPVPLLYGFVGLVALSLLWTPPSPSVSAPAGQHIATNKTGYFLGESAGLVFGSGGNSERTTSAWTGTGVPADSIGREYPWMYRAHYDDVLSPFLRRTPDGRPPNVVFIVFEGLGKAFVGDDAPYGGFTPFVDSLAQNGLYWKNFLSTTGRTFGLMPSLFGSLPYAENGFMAMGRDMPRHQSLIRLLDDAGYFTSYYSGFDIAFDNVGLFLERQGLDRLVDRPRLSRTFGGDPGVAERYWGYPDKEMVDRVSTILDTTRRQPRLEILHTLQTHDPFVVPDEGAYAQRFNRRLQRLDLSPAAKERYRTYEDELTTFLYTDDALRQFIERYRQRPEYDRTIFVITGDHRLIPIPQPSQIARYHVPLIVHSPLLTESETFASVSTLADVPPTLLGYLQSAYGVSVPERAHWLGTGIDTTRQFRNVHSMPLMRNKNQLIDYVHRSHYLAGDQLYRLKPGMELAPIEAPDTRQTLQRRMTRFKTINTYVTREDRLYDPEVPLADLPPTTPFRAASAPPAPGSNRQTVDSVLARIETDGLNTSEQFQLARQTAFEGEYDVARAIARKLLADNPGFHDVRTLLGRTYSWTRQFDRARTAFRDVIRRDSTYPDAYNALADAELWAGRPDEALAVVNDGLKQYPERPSFLAKKAKALLSLGRTAEAARVVAALERVAPDHPDLPDLKEQTPS